MTLVVLTVLSAPGQSGREVKFQGALLARERWDSFVAPDVLQREIDALNASIPTLMGPTILIGSGSGSLLAGVGILAGLWAIRASIAAALTIGVAAWVLFPLGIVLGVIGLVLLPIQREHREQALERIEELKAKLARSSDSIGARDGFSSGAVLAAF